MKRALRLLLLGAALPAAAQVAPPDAFPNLPTFTEPMDVTAAGDGSNQLYVAERGGRVYAFVAEPSASARTLFLDLSDRLDGVPADGGLQSLAFPPGFATSRYVVVHYVSDEGGGRTVVARFDVTEGGVADPASEVVLLDVPREQLLHNGGKVLFGPDGYLYVPLGDGACCDDPYANGQDRTVLLGKVLRLDVEHPDPGLPYGIPPDNPYVGNTEGWREEIWAYGFRNPWRSSFDPEGRLWIGDVGEVTWEEVNLVEAGQNHGWNVWEGFECHAPPCESPPDLAFPVHAYRHDEDGGFSVAGGYVYRGSRNDALLGRYLFADVVSHRVWTLDAATPQAPDVRLLGTLTGNPWVAAFGEDEAGELYALSYARGRLYDIATWATLVAAEPGPEPGPAAVLLGVSPNPFRRTATAEVAHPESGPARVAVADARGRVVETLFDGVLGAGRPARFPLEAAALAAGTYFLTLSTPEGTWVQPFTVVR